MCYYSQLIKNPKYTPNKKNGGVVPYMADKRAAVVPIGCGECKECRKAKQREWQVRLKEDIKHNTNGKFITLTFSNEWIAKITREVTQKTTKIKNGIKSTWIDKNGKLCHRYKYKYVTEEVQLKGYDLDNAIAIQAVRKFNERWRKHYGKAIRHWLVTELGHNGTENIHLHGIIWTDNTEELAKIWKYGFIWDGKRDSWGRKKNYVSAKTINYIIKYVTKVDLKHKFYKQIILTSAGIGAGYMNRTDWIKNKFNPNGETREYYKTETGHKQALPIYWRNKIYSEEEREKLWLQKLDKEERYVNGQKIDISENFQEYWKAIKRARIENKELGYGERTKDYNQKQYEEELRMLLIQKRITAYENANAPQALRGLGIAPESAESVNSSLCSLGAEKDITKNWGMYEHKSKWEDGEEPDWVNENGIIVSW